MNFNNLDLKKLVYPKCTYVYFLIDPDVTMTSSDGVFVISKAVELFVESLAIESYTYTANSKKKTISRQDVEKAIDAVDALAFLDGAMDD